MDISDRRVLVAGDVIIDHHLYRGDRPSPGSSGVLGTRAMTTPGGAALLCNLLREVARQTAAIAGQSDGRNRPINVPEPFAVDFGLDESFLEELCAAQHCYGLWEPKPRMKGSKDSARVWRLTQALGYGSPPLETEPVPPGAESLAKPADILVMDDGALGFRNRTFQGIWPVVLRNLEVPPPEWIVLKMSHPIACGDLWREIASPRLRDRTIIVISISDIRLEEVRVSRRLSWERTALDLVEELCCNPALAPLRAVRHAIISFGLEGALHVERGRVEGQESGAEFRLVFDPIHLEGDWQSTVEGESFGYMSCLAAGVVSRLLIRRIDAKTKEPLPAPIDEGIIAGLEAGRTMRLEGHGRVGNSEPRLPLEEAARTLLQPPTENFYVATVPVIDAQDPRERDSWTIIAGRTHVSGIADQPLFGIARRVAMFGPSELKRIPSQRFGGLLTVDRGEIESLRNVRQAIEDYASHDQGKKPLSIAVFGAPGSGKSYSVEEIAQAVLGERVPILKFNLSQFSDSEDLIGALHQVRDAALGPLTPVVFWDEFDSRDYDWLPLLLSPMEDGTFQQGQITHPIGKSVFIFAGGTSYDFENFALPPDDGQEAEQKQFRLRKVPDFKSRLHIYLNVLGPDPRLLFDKKTRRWGDAPDSAPKDICYPIRRALLLRSFLGLEEDRTLDIDDGVLTAILELPRYKHGARSMQNVVRQFRRRDRPGVVRRSDIPSREVMSMHADYEQFIALANRDLAFKRLADEIAPAVHAYYSEHMKKTGQKSCYAEEFEKLEEEIKDDNRAAARRIPQVLSIVGLYVIPREATAEGNPGILPANVESIIQGSLEQLAEAEHNGWCKTRLSNGWRYGRERRNKEKIHPALVPYSELDPNEKAKDRESILSYKDILALVNFTISDKPA